MGEIRESLRRHVLNALSQPDLEEGHRCTLREYLELWREPGVPVGLSLRCGVGAVVTAVHGGSPADDWNVRSLATFPAVAIRRFDVVVRANGAGPAGADVLQEFRMSAAGGELLLVMWREAEG